MEAALAIWLVGWMFTLKLALDLLARRKPGVSPLYVIAAGITTLVFTAPIWPALLPGLIDMYIDVKIKENKDE